MLVSKKGGTNFVCNPYFLMDIPQWPYWDLLAANRQQFNSHWYCLSKDKVSHPPPTHPGQEKIFEEQEARVEEEITPEFPISSSLLEEAVIASSPSTADNFRQFQDVIRRVADTLPIPLVEVKDPQHKLLDTFAVGNPPFRVALLINVALLDLAKTVMQMLASIAPMDSSFLFSHLPPYSLLVDAVNEQVRQQFFDICPL